MLELLGFNRIENSFHEVVYHNKINNDIYRITIGDNFHICILRFKTILKNKNEYNEEVETSNYTEDIAKFEYDDTENIMIFLNKEFRIALRKYKIDNIIL